MTARSVATIASLVLLGGSLACTNFYEIPIETPIQPKMDVSAFSRVLVAGFIGGGTDDVDANLETVRLLRSQLRTKSNLRVIDAEVLPLAEMARDQAKNGADAPPVSPDAADGQQPAPPDQAGQIKNEKDLEKYQGIFADAAFWKKIGEEYQNPLIVTGTVLFTPIQTSGFVPRQVEAYDAMGRRSVTQVRVFMERKGFNLQPQFIFIDGRTGSQLYAEKLQEQRLYPAQQNTPALSSYFELMDQLIPSFLNALSTQKIRGTRVLLK
ncbi:MAG: hypothetical protein LC753_16470 [Acidobacteria bacterium]|nr:hypothetical protein [Acidobacteriota bacterium]MCA1651789.1 hypothetical protein [Acidobacteriota bacterium]